MNVNEEAVARLVALAEGLGLISEDLDEFVYESTNEVAASRVNEGDFPEDEDWYKAYARLHDEADKQASKINDGDMEGQLAYLLERSSEEGLALLMRDAAA
jgi:hypothetical protein